MFQLKQPLSISIEYLLQYTASDGSLLTSFFKHGVKSGYNHMQQPRKARKIKDFYKISDNRAPDKNKVLFTGKDPVYTKDLEVDIPAKRCFEDLDKGQSIDINTEDEEYISAQNFIKN
jgi:hypothetical protein